MQLGQGMPDTPALRRWAACGGSATGLGGLTGHWFSCLLLPAATTLGTLPFASFCHIAPPCQHSILLLRLRQHRAWDLLGGRW